MSEHEKTAYRQNQLRRSRGSLRMLQASQEAAAAAAASPHRRGNTSLVPTSMQRRSSSTSWGLMPSTADLLGGTTAGRPRGRDGAGSGTGFRKLVPPPRNAYGSVDDDSSMSYPDEDVINNNNNEDKGDIHRDSGNHNNHVPPLLHEEDDEEEDPSPRKEIVLPPLGVDRDGHTKHSLREQRLQEQQQQQQEIPLTPAVRRSHYPSDDGTKQSLRDQRNNNSYEGIQPLPPSSRVRSSSAPDDGTKQRLREQRNNSHSYEGTSQQLLPPPARSTIGSSSSTMPSSSGRASHDESIKQRLREERNRSSSFDNNYAAAAAAVEPSSPHSAKARAAGYGDAYEPSSTVSTAKASSSGGTYGYDNRLQETSKMAPEPQKPPPERQQSVQQFAMKSIERGSDDWNTLLEPFVSDLCYQSVVSKRTHKSITFRPHPCQAALLFVDLSGYSKITSALAYAGAHAISACVNSYLSRLVRVLKTHGGDCVKFAGDAIMVVWAGQPHELEINVYCAARAALILQAECGNHPVPGTDHQFQIHCGLAAGTLHSEVFCAPKQNRSMPRLYHVLSGETVQEIGDLVDLAASGELCVSQNCVSFLEGSGRYRYISDVKLADNGPAPEGAKLLVDLVVTSALTEYMDSHIVNKKQQIAEQRQAIVKSNFAEDFIHNSVLDALQHGGLSPTQIAQMRELCVLFIAMTSGGDAVNWLIEVQEILDRNRCPIVQIIQ